MLMPPQQLPCDKLDALIKLGKKHFVNTGQTFMDCNYSSLPCEPLRNIPRYFPSFPSMRWYHMHGYPKPSVQAL